MGIPSSLAKAYPPKVREEIGAKVRILDPEIPYEKDWRDYREVLEQADVIMSTWGVRPLDAEFLSVAKNLKAIFYAAGSVKCFMTPEAFARGIVVSSAQSANAIPVSEYCAATALLSLKRFWSHSRDLHTTGVWQRDPEVPGAYASTVGFVSFGLTARRTADILSRFNLDLIAFDPFVPAEQAGKLGVQLVSLEEVFRRSNVVSIHAPSLPETKGLVGPHLLEMMKPGAALINTSRGAVIDQTGLCEVLKKRTDLTAILDVTDPEPPSPDSALLQLSNVVLTPHIAGSMGGEIQRLGQWMSEELTCYLSGEPLRFQVTESMLATMA